MTGDFYRSTGYPKVTGATAMTADRFVGQLYAELKAGR